MKLILASTSIHRKNQLKQIVSDFSCQPSGIDEAPFKKKLLDPAELASSLAYQKALAVKETEPDAVVIGGDQVAWFENKAMSKPGDHKTAVTHFEKLRGNTHELYTATCILVGDQKLEDLNITTLKMKNLSDEEIESYLHKDEPYDCAGGYKYEKNGHALFEEVKTTDLSSITGLPLEWTKKTLASLSKSLES